VVRRSETKGTRTQSVRIWLFPRVLVFFGFFLLSCSNNPYPDADNQKKVIYLPFVTPPKTLDPAVSYGSADTVVTNKLYDTLLEYHYLRRPYQLMSSMALEIPKPEPLVDGRVRYSFHLREGILFQKDDCFSLSGSEGRQRGQREVTARDFVFEIQRVGDPKLASQVLEPFSNLYGLREFSERLSQRRKADPNFDKLPIREQYEKAGPFLGAVAPDDRTLVVTLKEPYPQILYWFAMPVMTPVPWEAVEYYNGAEGRVPFGEHPISTGPYLLTEYEKQARMVLERNPSWWGLVHRDAPGSTFPELEAGAEWDDMRASVGKKLPLLDRFEYRREQESIPSFNKFIQGYYDTSGIVKESFDRVVHEGGLSKEMHAKGMRLSRSVEPSVYYIGFNMDDPVIGRDGGERSRKLRQAMSLSIDVHEYLRLFSNGRGLPAHSPLPPGIFGYEEGYKNPYRERNLDKARQFLVEAGLANGIDPKTGKPLTLTFDVGDTSPEGRVRFMFWVNQWRKLGLDVQLDATSYNQFYAKMLKGSYQIYIWGWMADYPDPENFYFLLTGPMAHSISGGPNNANFKNAEYDRLFGLMRTRENDDERLRIMSEMRGILEVERPWVELYYPESYALVHGWLDNVRPSGITTISTGKYYDMSPEKRVRLRKEWNKPIYWPAFVLLFLLLALLIPGIWTYYRERT
jgi:oligopeptide transport system substrate-binding protein